jgi:hypothetical protein
VILRGRSNGQSMDRLAVSNGMAIDVLAGRIKLASPCSNPIRILNLEHRDAGLPVVGGMAMVCEV